jgi:hypothetical protein
LIRLRTSPLPLQGFDPYGRLFLPFGLFSLLGTSTLLGFFLLRGFSFRRRNLPRNPSSPGLFCCLRLLQRPFGVFVSEKLDWLSRVSHPFRGLSPSRLSRIFACSAFLGYPSETVQCYHLPAFPLRFALLAASAHLDTVSATALRSDHLHSDRPQIGDRSAGAPFAVFRFEGSSSLNGTLFLSPVSAFPSHEVS